MNVIDQIKDTDIKLKPELTGKHVTVVLRDKHETVELYVKSDGRGLRLVKWDNSKLNLEEMRITRIKFIGLLDFLDYYFKCHKETNVTKERLMEVMNRIKCSYGGWAGKLTEAFIIEK